LLSLMDLELGWPAVAYKRARANPDRPARESVTDLAALAEERNRLDRELHAFAGELLTEAVGRVDAEELAAEAEVLRRAGEKVDIRSLPVEARAALARKEAQL